MYEDSFPVTLLNTNAYQLDIDFITGVLTAQSVPSGHQVTLSQIKPGQTTSVGGQIPQQQLIMQQLHRQQFQIQPFQQVRPQTTTANQMQANAKAKNKKRTTPTPPKH